MKDGNPLIGIGIFVIAILLTAYYFDIAKKRFHDFNMSGWYGLLLFIPVLNFIILLGLFFIPGTKKQDNMLIKSNTWKCPEAASINLQFLDLLLLNW